MTAYERVIYVYIEITYLNFVNYCTNLLSRPAGAYNHGTNPVIALGRTFRVGDLYNYFTDKTVSTGKIFKICYVVSGYVYFVMNSLCHD